MRRPFPTERSRARRGRSAGIRSRRGVALILVLTTVAILSSIAVEFGYQSRVSLRLAENAMYLQALAVASNVPADLRAALAATGSFPAVQAAVYGGALTADEIDAAQILDPTRPEPSMKDVLKERNAGVSVVPCGLPCVPT